MTEKTEESLKYDVIVVGGGPAGLSAAIHLKNKAKEAGKEISVCILEKGSEIGAHILSGAVFDPKALKELIPDYKEKGAPLETEAKKDHFLLLNEKGSLALPTPPQMKNHGNYIISLGNLCKWLGQQAASRGIDIFPGFAAKKPLFTEDGKMCGVMTGEMGVDQKGEKTPRYQPGVKIEAPITLLAEGCHGSLSKQLIDKYNLREGKSPQTYALGLKEVWEISPEKHQEGDITHTIGWPLDNSTYGGSFIYHMKDNQISIGFVVGLDYKNPYLSPYHEFQRFKHHPKIKYLLEGGRRLSYGARALTEGGWQSIPKLTFPGGALIGCAAGFMNVPKIKGSHTAMKSGMLAAEACLEAITAGNHDISSYENRFENSWVAKELKAVRNIRPGFQKGLYAGMLNAALEAYILRGNAPWTLSHHKDHESLIKASEAQKIDYPRPDGIISFDRLSSVFISNTNHEEKQPCHLVLKDKEVAINHNLALYDAPEQRYCPAGVYEIVGSGETAKLQINSQNCVHCKTCDIKDPTQNINWEPPEGGGGPNYSGM